MKETREISKAVRGAISRRKFLHGAGLTLASLALANQTAMARRGIGGVSASAPSGFLPTGHYEPALLPMRLVYPRPSGETNTYSPERFAYFNPTTQVGIQYRKRVGVSFGSWPYVYELMSGPPGMTIGATEWNSSWDGNPAAAYQAGYGVVIWTPAAQLSGQTDNVHVRVYDQNYPNDPTSYVDVIWSLNTGTDGAPFYFIDAVNGNDSNPGSLASPWQSPTKAFGSNYSTATNQGKIIIARAGTYTGSLSLPGWTDNTYTSSAYFEWNPQKKPAALIGYPGETPIFDMSSSGLAEGTVGIGSDCLIQNIKFSGYNSSQLDYRWVWFAGNRYAFQGISGDTIGDGTGGGNNAGLMFFGDASPGAESKYCFVTGCAQTNRQSGGGGGNSYSFCSFYSFIDCLVELNSDNSPSASSLSGGFYFKSAVEYGEMRANFANYSSQQHAFSVGQSPTNGETSSPGTGPGTQNCESMHNIGINIGGIDLPNTSGYMWGDVKAARNSIIGKFLANQPSYNLIAPYQNSPVAGTAGSLATGTYYFTITTYGVSGETTIDWISGTGNEKSCAVTGPNGSVSLSWLAVPNASGYRVYIGTSAGGESGYIDVGNVVSFIYTGQAATAGTAPATNTAISSARITINSNAAQTAIALPSGAVISVGSGSESNSIASSGLLDPSTGLLTGTYANPPSGGGILGTVGAQISATP